MADEVVALPFVLELLNGDMKSVGNPVVIVVETGLYEIAVLNPVPDGSGVLINVNFVPHGGAGGKVNPPEIVALPVIRIFVGSLSISLRPTFPA